MVPNFGKGIAAAAAAGLVLGTLAGCVHQRTPRASGQGAAGASAGEKACCKGKNECKGKGGCAVAGRNNCAGTNDCKGQGGCNGHCPK